MPNASVRLFDSEELRDETYALLSFPEVTYSAKFEIDGVDGSYSSNMFIDIQKGTEK